MCPSGLNGIIVSGTLYCVKHIMGLSGQLTLHVMMLNK